MDSRPGGAANGLSSRLNNTPALAVLTYCLSSISMTIINKYCVSGPHWNLNFFYLAYQCTVVVCAVCACHAMGWADLTGFDKDKARKWLPVSVVLVGMIYTSTKALQFLSVPVYTIFKNLTIIVIAYGEAMWFNAKVTPMALTSFGMMVLSSIVAAWAEIQIALSLPRREVLHAGKSTAAQLSTLNAGYLWIGLNVFCSASFALGMRKTIKKLQFTDWDTILYNNLLMMPILLLCSLLLEDWSKKNILLNFPPETRRPQIIAMSYAAVATVYMSYASAWCIRITTSTTFSMVSALNKLPIALSGLVLFGSPATFGSVSAIALGFAAGLVYTWAKIRQASLTEKWRLPEHESKFRDEDS